MKKKEKALVKKKILKRHLIKETILLLEPKELRTCCE